MQYQSIDQVTISENNNNNLPRFKKLFISLKFQSIKSIKSEPTVRCLKKISTKGKILIKNPCKSQNVR